MCRTELGLLSGDGIWRPKPWAPSSSEGSPPPGWIPTPVPVPDGRGLRLLDLQDNIFAGSIPSELGNLQQLTSLRLGKNHFSSSIPSDIANLKYLEHLALEHNDLTGTMPTEMTFLFNLTELDLSGNANLEGELILPRVTTRLATLAISGTSLSGTIPGSICDIARLEFDCQPGVLCGCDCPCGDS